MVDAFAELKEGIRPFLKLGHGERQKLAQNTGLPAIGWITNLYRNGDKLLADFDYIPEKVFKLLQMRAYRKVSCEVYFDLNIQGKKYPKVLGAVALLGAETPGVMNLEDILGQYSFNNLFADIENFGNAELYSFENPHILTGGTMPDDVKSDTEIALEQELAEQKAMVQKFELDKSAVDKELAEAKVRLQEFEAREQAALAEAEEARKEAFCAKMEAKKIVTPGMKDLVKELLGESKKSYSIADKTMSREELLEQVLALAHEAGKFNFTESSTAEFAKDGDKTKMIDKEIKDYQM